MASSPLPEVDEDVGDAMDLWDAASLDYPGLDANEPNGWEFMDQQVSYEEPRYHTWHLWLGMLHLSTNVHEIWGMGIYIYFFCC